MNAPVDLPLIRHVTHDEAGEALDRLIRVASDDTGGSRRAAEFLLSWWDGAEGAFPIINICNVDAETAEDMLIILAYLAQNNVTYADAWGRRADMERLIDVWNWKGRSGLVDQHRIPSQAHRCDPRPRLRWGSLQPACVQRLVQRSSCANSAAPRDATGDRQMMALRQLGRWLTVAEATG